MKRYSLLILALIFGISTQLWADDTDIYGTSTVSIPPNVLIIFDTSLSMATADVAGVVYDKNIVYSGGYTKDAVYWKDFHGNIYPFASDIDDLNCPAVKTDLEENGQKSGSQIYWSNGNYQCSTGFPQWNLYIGNYLNYEIDIGVEFSTRMQVAKDVITNVINNDTTGVRFGLMRFNHDHGGYLVEECGADKADLLTAINGFGSTGFTPLAETLAEAGLYFGGKQSWFNGSSGSYDSSCHSSGTGCKTYTSPMQYRCQKNYIILMTDGEPTYDLDAKLTSPVYINNDTIGDYDNDSNDPGPSAPGMDSSNYLDDVAKYLYEKDLNSSLGTPGGSFEKQNIIIYTIGFKTQQQLLSDAAQNGGGQYYTANSVSGLSAAFQDILTNIADVNSVFVSPVVPVSRMNRTFAGNSLYVGFFKPQSDGRWDGNIKKFGLNSLGQIVDADGITATLVDGTIKDNARSYWSAFPDGPDVLSGGIGQLLFNQITRDLYTYMGGSNDLTDTSNLFSTSNGALTAADLGVGTPAEKDAVINDIHGVGRSWIMGDILHSKPSVVHYDTDGNGTLDEAFIFAGTNGGIMHCFKDSDGSEVWGFVPPDQLPRLKGLSDGSINHKYFVDGVPVVYEDAGQKILFFGERRGGSSYYALDVTTYDSPSYIFTIGQTFLESEDGDQDMTVDGIDAKLGQSWSSPTVHEIKTSSGSDTVFLLSGGYDDNQDKDPSDPTDPQAPTDSRGRAVFTVKVSDGTISKLNVNAGYYADMTHSIVDVAGFDSNGNQYTNRVYAGDLAGNMFAFEDDDGNGEWSRRKLFSASAVDSVKRKIFYSPDAVEERFGEMIFFGTGDRANPEGTGVVNRIYAIKNDWEDPATFTTLTETELTDVTENLIVLGTEQQQTDTREALNLSKGWYIKLDQNAGEKVTSYTTVFDGVVYFTTYTPESGGGPPPADPCVTVSGRGTARLYALDYKTGEAAFEWSDIAETDGDGNTVNQGRWDRSKVIGTSIASAPVVAILEGGPQIYIGVEGGIQNINPNVTTTLETFFWRQMNN